jgi:hypothetical protein
MSACALGAGSRQIPSATLGWSRSIIALVLGWGAFVIFRAKEASSSARRRLASRSGLAKKEARWVNKAKSTDCSSHTAGKSLSMQQSTSRLLMIGFSRFFTTVDNKVGKALIVITCQNVV